MTPETEILTELRSLRQSQERIERLIAEEVKRIAPQDEPPLTAEQVAQRFNKKPKTIRDWARAGKLKMNAAGMFPMAEVRRFEQTKKHLRALI